MKVKHSKRALTNILFRFFQKQQALIERLGKTAYPFSLEVASLAPPSVQLVPAKRYTGAPIGTSYDIRVHLGKKNSFELSTKNL